jgi:hypothetical protein
MARVAVSGGPPGGQDGSGPAGERIGGPPAAGAEAERRQADLLADCVGEVDGRAKRQMDEIKRGGMSELVRDLYKTEPAYPPPIIVEDSEMDEADLRDGVRSIARCGYKRDRNAFVIRFRRSFIEEVDRADRAGKLWTDHDGYGDLVHLDMDAQGNVTGARLVRMRPRDALLRVVCHEMGHYEVNDHSARFDRACIGITRAAVPGARDWFRLERNALPGYTAWAGAPGHVARESELWKTVTELLRKDPMWRGQAPGPRRTMT